MIGPAQFRRYLLCVPTETLVVNDFHKRHPHTLGRTLRPNDYAEKSFKDDPLKYHLLWLKFSY